MKNVQSVILTIGFIFLSLFLLLSSISSNSDTDYIYISELMPNPLGTDTDLEWIELFNYGKSEINLKGYSIESTVIQTDLVIKPNDFIIFVKNRELFSKNWGEFTTFEVNISLKNTEDSVVLLNKEGLVVDEFTYTLSSSIGDNVSLERNGVLNIEGCNKYTLQSNFSLGKQNSNLNYDCLKKQEVLDITDGEHKIYFSKNNQDWSEDIIIKQDENFFYNYQLDTSYSELNLEIDDVKWKYGGNELIDGISFEAVGEYFIEVEITFKGGENLLLKSGKISVEKKEDLLYNTIIISEIFPSPDSLLGEVEWIEIYNYGENTVNLSGWYLKEKSTSSSVGYSDIKNFIKLENYLLLKDSYILIKKEEGLDLTLNNSGDFVGIFNKNNEEINSFLYGNILKSKSSSKIYKDGFYQNSIVDNTIPTPNEKNITQAEEDTSDEGDNLGEVIDEDTENIENDTDNLSEKDEEGVLIKDILDIYQLKKTSFVRIKGFISIEPNLLGENITYIQDNTAGIRLDVSNVNSSQLVRGQEVEILGKVSSVLGESKLNVTKIIYLKDSRELKFIDISNRKIGEYYYGVLVNLKGDVVRKVGNNVDLILDDKLVRIGFKVDLDYPKVGVGNRVEVSGVMSSVDGLLTVYPFFDGGVKVLNSTEILEDMGDDIKKEYNKKDSVEVLKKDSFILDTSQNIVKKTTIQNNVDEYSVPRFEFTDLSLEKEVISENFKIPISFLIFVGVFIFLNLIFLTDLVNIIKVFWNKLLILLVKQKDTYFKRL